MPFNENFLMPRAFLYDDKYSRSLSSGAKLLYSILLDLHISNQDNSDYIDENGDVFIYFENIAIEEILNVSDKKAIAIKTELLSQDLLKEIEQCPGEPSRLYLTIL